MAVSHVAHAACRRRVATGLLAQRHDSRAVGARGSRRSGSPRRTIGGRASWRPKSGCSAKKKQDEPASQVLLRSSATDPSLRALVALGASAVGDRAAVSGTQKRARPQPLRRTHLSGVAAPRRADGGRPRVDSTRADAPWRCWVDIPGRARHRARNLYRALVCGRNPATCIGWSRRNTSFNYGSDKVELRRGGKHQGEPAAVTGAPCTSARPPWASTTARTRLSPRPRPRSFSPASPRVQPLPDSSVLMLRQCQGRCLE